MTRIRIPNKQMIVLLFLFAISASMLMQPPLIRVQAWSGRTHGKIAVEAIESLPSPWKEFFSDYSAFFDDHGNDPDGYRSVVEDNSNVLFSIEDPKHFDDHNIKEKGGTSYDEHDPANAHMIDGEFTAEDLDFIAVNVSHTTTKYHKGVVEWAVANYTRDVTQCMIDLVDDPTNNEKWNLLLIQMCYVCHYAGDATMPFHAIDNYDGYLSGQGGIHGYTENTMTENPTLGRLDDVNFSHAPAVYVESAFNQTVSSVEGSLANVSAVLAADLLYDRLSAAWITNMWNDIGEMWGGRIDLAATSTANLWYTALVDSDMINQLNATFLNTLTLDATTAPSGWTSNSEGDLWYPSLPVAPTTTTTTTTTTAPGFDFFYSLATIAIIAVSFRRKRKN